MSYEPTNWKTGDVVTSAKLNKLENGVASGVLVVHINEETEALDKTWQEIHDALVEKTLVYIFDNNNGINHYPVLSAVTQDLEGTTSYFITTITNAGLMTVGSSTHSPDAYLDVWTVKS